MTRDRWKNDPDAVREAERIYRFIGEYVICFQWLEGKIDEMFLLANGAEKRAETLVWLTKKTNEKKVDAFYDLITAGKAFGAASVDGWSERLNSVVDRLHGERRRRNGILYAQFLFDFLSIGAPVMRAHVRRLEGNPIFDQEDLSTKQCENIIEEVAELSFDLGMICVQLYHVRKESE